MCLFRYLSLCVYLDIYHCVFGDLEESLQSCCYKALGSAREEKLSTIVFWLDGFAFLSGKSDMISCEELCNQCHMVYR